MYEADGHGQSQFTCRGPPSTQPARATKQPRELFHVAWQGTTTNGEYLLPFKTGAFLAGAPVQPVILCYGKVGTLNGLLFLDLPGLVS